MIYSCGGADAIRVFVSSAQARALPRPKAIRLSISHRLAAKLVGEGDRLVARPIEDVQLADAHLP